MPKTITGRDGKIRARYSAIDKIDDKLKRLQEASSSFESLSFKNNTGVREHFSFMLGHLYVGFDVEQTALREATEEGPQSRRAIARLLLIMRFTNSIYASYRLCTMGLIVDAMSSFRSAVEALQYWRLINIDETQLPNLLSKKNRLRPGAVRNELRKLGHPIENSSGMYSELSDIVHVGGEEFLTFDETEDGRLALSIGGVHNHDLQRQLYQDMIYAIHEWVAYSMKVREEQVVEYFEVMRSSIRDIKNKEDRMAAMGKAMLNFLRKNRSQTPDTGPGTVEQPNNG